MTSQSAVEAGGPSPSLELAVDRTRLAHERTLMAWVRTAASLISLGFTIYKFFQFLRESNQIGPERRLLGPREFALLMISIGIGTLVLATLQHIRQMKALRTRYPEVTYSLATALAGLISLFGTLALLAVIFRQ